MKRTIVLAALLAAGTAQAQTVGLHLYSYHADRDVNWNEQNFGLYLRWPNGITVGTYKNSIGRRSNYAGWTYEHGPFALTIGAVTGYVKVTDGAGDHTRVQCDERGFCREVNLENVVLPLVVPSYKVNLTPTIAARASALIAGKHTALHLSIEKEF